MIYLSCTLWSLIIQQFIFWEPFQKTKIPSKTLLSDFLAIQTRSSNSNRIPDIRYKIDQILRLSSRCLTTFGTSPINSYWQSYHQWLFISINLKGWGCTPQNQRRHGAPERHLSGQIDWYDDLDFIISTLWHEMMGEIKVNILFHDDIQVPLNRLLLKMPEF